MNHHDHTHDTATSILDPVREVTIGNNKISVRELPWPQAIKFLKMLASHAGKLKQDGGSIRFELDQIAELIAGASELSEFLILHSTSTEASTLALESIGFGDALTILDAALSVNLTAEIAGKTKKIAGRFALAMGVNGERAGEAKTRTSPPVSTS